MNAVPAKCSFFAGFGFLYKKPYSERRRDVPTRLHIDGLRRHAGTHAVMVTHSDSVELATFQVGYAAASVSGAAAEKSLFFIHNGGGVRVHSGLATPRNQSLIGCTIQRGSNLIWRTSS